MLRRCLANLKKINLPHAIREKVWTHYLGNTGEAPCFCCEKSIITPFKFECAHIIAESKGGNSSVNNLLPCCGVCNRSMGTMNFFVFKSKMHDNFHYNQNDLSLVQKKVINYYNQKEETLTCKDYLENYRDWMNILENTMSIEKKEKKDEIINNFLCDCNFDFTYITKKRSDLHLTCGNSKQNLIDVICDHIPCLINKKKFVNLTIKSDSYKKWMQEQKEEQKEEEKEEK
jgi:hypothetical protein